MTTDESTFECLRQFRALSPEERIERLFMDLQDVKRADAATAKHLGILNGSTGAALTAINLHLANHKTQTDQRQGMSLLGSGAQRAIVFASVAFAVILAIFNILEHL